MSKILSNKSKIKNLLVAKNVKNKTKAKHLSINFRPLFF